MENKLKTEDETTAKAIVVEFCSDCETEIEMRWDVKTQGYKAFCPVCGKRLMLCDACQHRGEDGELMSDCDYDSQSDTCRFNPKSNGGNPQDSGRAHCLLLDDWMLPDNECYSVTADGTRIYDCQYEIEKGTCKLLSHNNTRKGGDAR